MNAPSPSAKTEAELLVRTRCGALAGSTVQAHTLGPAVRVWRGIPYAEPPVGALRWRPPAPAQPWSGVRPAHSFGPDFPQAAGVASRAPRQDEDCLYLNVWSPAGAQPGSLPVMVWIHGGGFVSGSGADARCDGALLATEGVVVVTFNYRSGMFGFLAHPALSAESPDRVSGNYGLLDQMQALRWVREEIAGFGGDPARVTVFGVSAGSASISLLLTSPMAHGLFDQAILHSPGAGRPLATLADAERAGQALGDDLDAMRRLSAAEVLERTALLSPKVRGLTTPRVLRPILDGHLLPQDERPAFQAGQIHPMPMIVGSNADEGTLLTRTWPVDTLAQYRALVETNFGAAAQEALAVYPAHEDAQGRVRIAELFADTQFNYGTRLLAQTMSRLEPRTWRYLYMRRRPGQGDGPHHGEEVGHVFGNLAAGRAGETLACDDEDRALSATMRRVWTTFARQGDPNATSLPAWPAYTSQDDTHLVFDAPVRMDANWRREQLDFLDAFYDRRDGVV